MFITTNIRISLIQGEGGIPLPNLLSNYFKLHGKPDWGLHQYRVDFSPEEDQTFIRYIVKVFLK